MDEIKRDELLEAENTILQDISGVLEAMETVTRYEVFEVVREGKKLFSFRVRGLDDEEIEKCRDQATKVVKDRRFGSLAVPRDFNAAKFNSLMIYTATHPEDRKALWDNKTFWEKTGVVTGWQLVDKVLKRGEKDAVIELIEKLSGYGEDNENLEETLKNS
ncbi:Phage XkdN-like protein [Thermoanaerobacter thermohydrosulfuricus WC1]|uniref:Phage XkdN-like protein n=1 Tax=Thermoanaerobacter thermohydrosulfuricus WC1 TaxID=1198630 RepID=M8CLM0_THETY|nr:phage XkdN-like protein [Thermoanaerobacter thermohydrosulfuricus]EMT38125.1 Phage XkdN-like protein [Thermoanaerobacter thermohydrosulfuricus WC1]